MFVKRKRWWQTQINYRHTRTHKTVFSERSTLNQDTLIGFLSGKEENIQVLKYMFFTENSETPSCESEPV